MRRMRFVLSALLAIAWLPAAEASAVTASEIVSLTKAGVSEPIILALIERDKTIFSIAPEQVIALQRDGVSDVVILAMLKSGRQEPPTQVAPAPPAPVPEYQSTEPNIVLIGQGPDQLNAPYAAPTYAVPYFVPVPYAVPVRGPRSHHPVRPFIAPNQEFRSTMPPVPPAPPATAPGVNGIFFTSPPPRGIFFDR